MIEIIPEISLAQKSWRNDPRINAFTRQNGIITDADMTRWHEKINTDPTIKMFGIAGGEPVRNIGTMGLTSIDYIHGKAEFSLLIDPKEHGNGYGKAALIELLKYGFKNLRLNLIWGETFVGNHALKMFLDIGMREEGHLQERYFKNGKYIDSIMVSITNAQARSKEWFE